MSDYKPISCSFYDQLEALAVQRVPVILVCMGPDNQTITLESRIVDFKTRDSKEYCLLANGTECRLDTIISANGIAAEGTCQV